jgi:NhaP-type Na+/H+ or K+/H+ antiporter
MPTCRSSRTARDRVRRTVPDLSPAGAFPSSGREHQSCVNDLHLAYALVGALGVLLAFVASRIRDFPVSEPLLALVLGVLAGPQVLGLVDVPDADRNGLVLEGSRLLLAVALMGVALRFSTSQVRPLVRPLTVIIVLGMLGMAAITTGLAALVLGLPLALAALLGACLTPTDPVLAGSVVTGGQAEDALPARTRQLLSEESGANDGLAYVFVVLAIAVVVGHDLPSETGQVAYAVLVAVLIGVAIGVVAGKAVNSAMARKDSTPVSLLVFTVVLAVAALGAARLANTDGVLAVFVTGIAYNAVVEQEERSGERDLDEALNRYLVLPLFFLFGVELPWSEWVALGWGAVLFPLAVLLLRRPPVLLALAVPLRLRFRDAVFLGWFGPIGVSALFYLAHAEHQGVHDPRLWAAGSLVVAASTVAHGISAAPGRRRYASVAARDEAAGGGS